MYVQIQEFKGFTAEITTRKHTVSTITDGMALFEKEVIVALSENMDVYTVALKDEDGWSCRRIVFGDRHDARVD